VKRHENLCDEEGLLYARLDDCSPCRRVFGLIARIYELSLVRDEVVAAVVARIAVLEKFSIHRECEIGNRVLRGTLGKTAFQLRFGSMRFNF
jgi:hypothetical protein